MTRAPVLLVLSFLFVSSVFAAELPVADPSIAPAMGQFISRADPSVAAGDGFLVAWSESYIYYSSGVMIRTYDDDGTPRQPVSTVVASGRTPRAVWTGTDYLLVYAAFIGRFGTPEPVPAILAVRVRPDATIVEGSRVVLAEGRSAGGVLDVVWTGQRAMVHFQLEGRRRLLALDAAGRVIEDDSVAVSSTTAMVAGAPGEPLFYLDVRDGDIAAVGPGRVAIVDNTALGVVVALRDGQRSDAFVVAPPDARASALVWDGSAWLAMYTTASAVCTVRFTRESDVTRQCIDETRPLTPALAAGRTRVLRAWSRGFEQLVVEGEIASLVYAAQHHESATLDRGGVLVAWIDAGRLHLGGFTSDGARREVHVVDTDHDVYDVRVLSAGAQSLLAWVERDGSYFATRVDASGTPVPPAVRLSGAGEGLDAPSIATNGTEWLVAWRQSQEIVTTLISPNFDGNGLQHFGADGVQQTNPSVAATDDGFVVTWSEDEVIDRQNRVRVVAERLDARGLRVSGGVRLFDEASNGSGQGFTLWPTLGCGARTCVVTWTVGDRAYAQLIGADAQRRGEAHEIGATGSIVIVASPNGAFRLYSRASFFDLDADGNPIGSGQWTARSVDQVSAVLVDGLRTLYVYERGGRVYVQVPSPRARAVRH
ncbi:MAG TPA: hypothetical protein VF824_04120 [Thermoanaerobaculia bacterium]